MELANGAGAVAGMARGDRGPVGRQPRTPFGSAKDRALGQGR